MPPTTRKRAIEGSHGDSTLVAVSTGAITSKEASQAPQKDGEGEDESTTLVKRRKLGSEDDDDDVIDLEKSQFTNDSDDNQLAEFDFSGFDDPSMCDDIIGGRIIHLMNTCGVPISLDQEETTKLGEALRDLMAIANADESEGEGRDEKEEEIEEIEGVVVAKDRISGGIHIAILAALADPEGGLGATDTLLESKKDTLRSTIRRCLSTVTFSEDPDLRALNFSEGISKTLGCA